MTEDALQPVGPGPRDEARPDPSAVEGAAPPSAVDAGDGALLSLIDRLAGLLDRSDLTELEVEAGGTALTLRKPAAIAPALVVGSIGTAGQGGVVGLEVEPLIGGGTGPHAAPERPAVKAPLTGIFYASPAPGSAPYVQAGGEVAVGQVIGLIEAMKLFNEIKSDLAGRVVKVVPESGTLVKAKQPLIEVEPL
jgi:acetyl-CoA carboxylase biotin carboxyl carrier protein